MAASWTSAAHGGWPEGSFDGGHLLSHWGALGLRAAHRTLSTFERLLTILAATAIPSLRCDDRDEATLARQTEPLLNAARVDLREKRMRLPLIADAHGELHDSSGQCPACSCHLSSACVRAYLSWMPMAQERGGFPPVGILSAVALATLTAPVCRTALTDDRLASGNARDRLVGEDLHLRQRLQRRK